MFYHSELEIRLSSNNCFVVKNALIGVQFVASETRIAQASHTRVVGTIVIRKKRTVLSSKHC